MHDSWGFSLPFTLSLFSLSSISTWQLAGLPLTISSSSLMYFPSPSPYKTEIGIIFTDIYLFFRLLYLSAGMEVTRNPSLTSLSLLPLSSPSPPFFSPLTSSKPGYSVACYSVWRVINHYKGRWQGNHCAADKWCFPIQTSRRLYLIPNFMGFGTLLACLYFILFSLISFHFLPLVTLFFYKNKLVEIRPTS